MSEILIATTNKGKIKELGKLLESLPIQLKSLQDFGKIEDVEETGKTFAENAALKARYYAKQTNCLALADDSGLEVEALSNEPGVYSARYAGIDASDKNNVAKLLNELEKTKDNVRNARFVCEMTISDNVGRIVYTARGVCTGNISLTPFGGNGFGYDPVFIPTGYTETFGELSSEIKQQISHRSMAMKQIIDYLLKYSSYSLDQ